MANLPLAFAEILAGGVLLTAGITGDTLGQVMKGQIVRQPVAGAANSSAAAGTAAGAATSGSSPTAYATMSEQGGVTPTSFATQLLQSIGAPLTKANIQSLVDWQAREGGNWHNTASFNPLNTTLQEPGSTVMGGGSSAGVQAYQNWAQGLDATVQTLKGGGYSDILGALQSGKGFIGQNLPGLYTWSGHSYTSVN